LFQLVQIQDRLWQAVLGRGHISGDQNAFATPANSVRASPRRQDRTRLMVAGDNERRASL